MKTCEYDDPNAWDDEDWTGFYRTITRGELYDRIGRHYFERGENILVTCKADDYRWWCAVWRGIQVEIHDTELRECCQAR